MREQPNISEEHLRACLQEQYGLLAVTLEFLPLGLDTKAGVYRVVSEQGTPYLLKAKSGSFYEPSCRVPRYLWDQGIASVVAPLATQQDTLWTQMGEWTVIVYPFIDGESGWNPGMTDGQWRSMGAALHQIHQISLPHGGFAGLRQETFDPTEYGRQVRAFDAHFACSAGGSQPEQELRSCWLAHQTTIHTALTALAALARVLRQQAGPHVICHADLHPGNTIRDQADRVFMIDWDDVMLAPKERDFLFVEDAPVDAAARQGASPFFQGYGQTEIDWNALTYYLWERAVTDLIESAHIVVDRDDVGEATKADELQVFRDTLAAGGMVDSARAAAAHLPTDP